MLTGGALMNRSCCPCVRFAISCTAAAHAFMRWCIRVSSGTCATGKASSFRAKRLTNGYGGNAARAVAEVPGPWAGHSTGLAHLFLNRRNNSLHVLATAADHVLSGQQPLVEIERYAATGMHVA